jgi:hypothetical protein
MLVSHSYTGLELLFQILLVFMYIVSAYGLLKLRNWARIMGITISILAVFLGFITMFAINLGIGAFIIVTHGLTALYLLKTECRNIYKKS